GPRLLILWITVTVIKAPMTPPSKVYLFSTCHSAPMLSRPVKNHATMHTRSAENCTHPVETQRLLCLVTWVLNTPWILISAPDSMAIQNPNIKNPSILQISGRKAGGFFYSMKRFFLLYSSQFSLSASLSQILSWTASVHPQHGLDGASVV